MRKYIYLFSALILWSININKAFAGNNNYGFFNSLTVGVSGSTTGLGFDISTPIGNYFQLRVGMNMIPDISYNDNLSFDANYQTYSSSYNVDINGSLKRSTTDIILNLYPFKRSSFFIAGGISIGGKEVIKINGHSDDAERLIAQGANVGIEIGDYNIPFDKNGDIEGGIMVKNSRPYFGLGFGRAVPKKRVGLMFELGAQLHGTPEVYTSKGTLNRLQEQYDNDYSKIIDNLKVYPVLKFRICGRIL